MSPKKGAVPKVRGAPPTTSRDVAFPQSRSQKTARTPPKVIDHGNTSVYLCQVCSVEDGLEKVCCDGCTLWYHFKCSNVNDDIVNQETWLCSSCMKSSESGAGNARIPTEHPTITEVSNLVDESKTKSDHSKQPHVRDPSFGKQPIANQPTRSTTSKSNRSHKSVSATSSMKRRTALALQKLEEERELLEQREIEAQGRQRERDRDYLTHKYSILDLEDDASSDLSFDDEELVLEKFDSTRRWAENFPPNRDPVVTTFQEVVGRSATPQQGRTNANGQSAGTVVISSPNKFESDVDHNNGARTSSTDQIVTTELQSRSRQFITDPHISDLYQRHGLPDWLTNPKTLAKPISHPSENLLQSKTSSSSHHPPVSSVALPFTSYNSIGQSNNRLTANITNAQPMATVYSSNYTATAGVHTNHMPIQQPIGLTYRSTLKPMVSSHENNPCVNYQSTGLIHQDMSSTFTVDSSNQQTSSNIPPIQVCASNYDAAMNYCPFGSTSQPMSMINPIGSSLSYQPNSYPISGQTFSNHQPRGTSNQSFWSSYSMPIPTTLSLVNTQPVNSQPAIKPQFNSLVTSHQSFGSTPFYQHQPASINTTFIPNSQPTNVYHSLNMNDGMNQSYGNGSFGAMANISIPSRLTAEQIAARHVMPRDLPHFDGNPNEWEAFISAFENSTETCGFSNSENLGRLQKCLKGDARTAVSSRLLHKDSVPGVIHTLRLMYGRPEFIIEKMIRDVQKMPPPKDDDLSSLVKFAISVHNLSSTIQHTGAVEHLRNPMLITSITDKLPAHLQLNWAFQKSAIGNVNIAHLGDWLYQLADVASQVVRLPIKSSHKRPDQTDSTTINSNSNSSKANQSTANPFLNTQVEITSSTNKSKDETNKSCPACNNNSCTRLANCKKFKDMSRTERWTVVKNNFLCGRCLGRHKFYRCLSDTKCTAGGCSSNHHTLLHNYDTASEKKSKGGAKSLPVNALDNNATGSDKSTCNSQRSEIAQRSDKFRIIPVMLHFKNKSVRDYAYLDDGSNMTTMEDSLAKELELTGSPKELCVDWAFGDTHASVNSRIVSVGISGYYENAPRFKMNNVRTVEHLHLPTQSIKTSWIDQYNHFKNIPIATYDSVKPRLLIGLQYSRLTVSLETIEGRENEPMVCRTRLGWVVQGPTFEVDDTSTKRNFSVNMCECQSNDKELHQVVKEFFAMENLGVKTPEKILESKELQRANKILEATTVKKDNRYESGLLWKYDDVELPGTYDMAIKRLKCLESKMAKTPELKANLFKQIEQFVEKGYIRKLSADEIKDCKHRVWYLPTFPVFNPKKPEKVRLVWDGAAKVKNTSLNENLLVGPDQLVPLPELLRRFRERAVAVTGDIEEMYHQIKVQESDQHVQRFLWRDDPSKEPAVYVMMVMTFGSKCSPSIAQYVKNKNASEFQDEFPRAAESIIHNHYVDDMIDCTHTDNEAEKLIKEVKMIHRSGGFNIRKFASNSSDLLEKIGENTNQQSKNLNMDNKLGTERVLGMFWDTATDSFTFSLKFTKINEEMSSGTYCPTKREVLQILMSVFDPLGLLANFLVFAKILLQEIWRSQIEWDEKLTAPIHTKWTQWIKALLTVEKLSIPRLYSTKLSPKVPKSIQLHTFVDASVEACAAVSYLRIEDDEGVDCCLVGAKTKVAPNKPMSVPRLELQAAVLGTRLAENIKVSQRLTFEKIVFWSDSQTVMGWINSEARRYNQFVSFRIGEILESTEPNQWRWVPSKQNVADEATKSKVIPKLSNNSRWFTAPKFLYDEESSWFKEDVNFVTDEELRPCFVMACREIQREQLINLERFSQWNRLVHAQAYVLRFIHNAKNSKHHRWIGPLKQEELVASENCLYKRAQRDCFFDEILVLKHNEKVSVEEQKPFDKSSELRTLSPYLDNFNVLRTRGRIDSATVISQDTKRPIILPRRHRITKLLVDYYHRRYKHLNHQTAMNEIRQRYIIPALRVVMKQVRNSCQKCKNANAMPSVPEMAELPPARLAAFTRPFTYTGVDYFGPYQVKV